jgi:hypothetical protein
MSEHTRTRYLAVVPDSAGLPVSVTRRLKLRPRRYQALRDLSSALESHLQHRKKDMSAEEALAWVRLSFDLLMFPGSLANDPHGGQWGIRRIIEWSGW